MNTAFSTYQLPVVEEKDERPYYEICDMTAKLINRPTRQILRLCKGWKVEKLRERYLQCEKSDNPAMTWWSLRRRDIEYAKTKRL